MWAQNKYLISQKNKTLFPIPKVRPVVLDQLCTHFNWNHSPLVHNRTSPDLSAFGAVARQHRVSAPSKEFQVQVQVWRLARPVHDIERLLLEQLLSYPGCVFWFVVLLEDPVTTQSMLLQRETLSWMHILIYPPLNAIRSSCPLVRKAFPKNDDFTTMGWNGVFFFLQTRWLEFQPKLSIFGLLWSSDLAPGLPWIILIVIGKLQAWIWAGLSAAGF